jgi:hypothetical protein
MNALRLARSLALLRRVNAWRMRRARYPRHVGAECSYVEAQLEQHDSDCRAGLRPEQRTIFEYIEEQANK